MIGRDTVGEKAKFLKGLDALRDVRELPSIPWAQAE